MFPDKLYTRKCCSQESPEKSGTAKTSDRPFLVGHVTKDGSLAGPKVLEHMVDTWSILRR